MKIRKRKQSVEAYAKIICGKYAWITESHMRRFTVEQTDSVVNHLVKQNHWVRLFLPRCKSYAVISPYVFRADAVISEKQYEYCRFGCDRSALFDAVYKMVKTRLSMPNRDYFRSYFRELT